MNNVGDVFAFGEQRTQRLTIFRVEELVRDDETEFAIGLEYTEALFDKNYIDVVITGTGRPVAFLIVVNLEGCPFFHVLDANVRRVADDATEAAVFHDAAEAGDFRIPIEGIDTV